MHENVLPQHSLELLDDLGCDPPPPLLGWTLAGGTGLAFRFGHRLSEDLFRKLLDKYGASRINTYHILKSLTYFVDAEKEPVPPMLVPFDWQECKAFFIREARAIILA